MPKRDIEEIAPRPWRAVMTNRVDIAVEAMREGVAARRASQPMSACPHGPGTSEGNQWRDGWRAEDRMIRHFEKIRRAAVPGIVDELKNAVAHRE